MINTLTVGNYLIDIIQPLVLYMYSLQDDNLPVVINNIGVDVNKMSPD